MAWCACVNWGEEARVRAVCCAHCRRRRCRASPKKHRACEQRRQRALTPRPRPSSPSSSPSSKKNKRAQTKQAVKKAVAGQLTLFPVYTAAFFAYNGALAGRPPAETLDLARRSFAATVGLGTIYWPSVNVLNFMYVPVAYRMLYLNAAGLAWNAFLSFQTS